MAQIENYLLENYSEEYGKLNPHQRDFKLYVDKCFRNFLDIDNRIYQVFDYETRNDANIITALWKLSAQYFPAYASAIQSSFETADEYIKLVSFLNTTETFKVETIDNLQKNNKEKFYGKVVNELFRSNWFSKSRSKIISSNKLTLGDFLLASLNDKIESPYDNPVIDFFSNNLDKIKWENASKELNKLSDKISNNIEILLKLDQELSHQQFIIYPAEKGIKIAPYGLWGGLKSISQKKETENNLIDRFNVLQSGHFFSKDSLENLEYLVNENADEKYFQNFFNANPEYLTTLGSYNNIHSHLILHEDNGNKIIPDFFLEKLDSKFCDICELKKPNLKLSKEIYNRTSFRDKIHVAVTQLLSYRDYFDDRYNREKFESLYGLNSFRPKVVLIAGRNADFESEISRIKLESELKSFVSLRTYDDILKNAQIWRSKIFR